MAVLKSLTFTALPQPGAHPVLDRRARVIERLEEQKRLIADPTYKRTVQTWTKGEDGKKTATDSQQRVQPWWRTNANGGLVFFIRAGAKAIEFEKGKAAIAVPSLDKLPTVIDTLISAVRAGELDDQLAQAGKQIAARKKKAA